MKGSERLKKWLKSSTQQIIDAVKKPLRIAARILLTVAIFAFMIWTGWKGLIAFLAGMGLMAYLILSENPLLAAALEMTEKRKR